MATKETKGAGRKPRTLEEKLLAVKIDEAIIQTSRAKRWQEFRNQYEDFIFREKMGTLTLGMVLGGILTFVALMILASTV